VGESREDPDPESVVHDDVGIDQVADDPEPDVV
jgi:hypothetical protein